MEYKYGRRKELQLGEFLERRGFKWRRTPGSRGPADIIAGKGTRRLLIQVKSTRKDYTISTKLSIDGENDLISEAKRFKALPVLALVSKNYVWLISVPSGKVLKEGELRLLKYDYPDER